MRIVGGALKGRVLRGPGASGGGPAPLRPTSDRLREAVFNILAHAYGEPGGNVRVLDLFAGTGALGIEALSRGAASAVFVDTSQEAGTLLRHNIEALGLGDRARVLRRDAAKLGLAPAGETFGLAFLDPPYGRDLLPRALAALRDGGWLAPGALCVAEEGAGAALPSPPGFAVLETRRYGTSQIGFLRLCDTTAVVGPQSG